MKLQQSRLCQMLRQELFFEGLFVVSQSMMQSVLHTREGLIILGRKSPDRTTEQVALVYLLQNWRQIQEQGMRFPSGREKIE
jgi:hypothetical protein